MRPLRVNELLKKQKVSVWYQDGIFLYDHSIVGTLKFGTTGRKKLKYPNMSYEKQWKRLEKEGQKKGINTLDAKKLVPLEQ